MNQLIGEGQDVMRQEAAPFIARFSREISVEEPLKDMKETTVEYDYEQECAVAADTQRPATTDPRLIPLLTGTFITKAKQDPTLDEPSDR